MRVWQARRTYAVFSNPANKKIRAEIESAGAGAVAFPTPEICPAEPTGEAENLLKDLSGFDWVIFPDVFAVDHFLRALEESEIDFYEMDAARVCAYGETVSDRLRYAQIHADVIANSIATDEVFSALRDYEPDLGEKRFLIVKEDRTTTEISLRLRASGARVTEFSVYLTRAPETAAVPKLKALLKGGAIDEFVFCSPEEIASLGVLLRPEAVLELLSGVEITATDAATRESLRETGFAKINLR